MTTNETTLPRLLMPDGAWWTAEFQHERAQLMRRGRERERRLFVFFRSADGQLRRATVPEDLKSTVTEHDLRLAWKSAECLSPLPVSGQSPR
ncbi:MAG TPA: hypothetical protein VIC55_11210 [Gemmatimonadaceae bacterium]|jgi:hypothetical protein